LEYCNSVLVPYKKSYIDKLEKVQKRATKRVGLITAGQYRTLQDNRRTAQETTGQPQDIAGKL